MHDVINQIKIMIVGLYCIGSLSLKVFHKQYPMAQKSESIHSYTVNSSQDTYDRVNTWLADVNKCRREEESNLWVAVQHQNLCFDNPSKNSSDIGCISDIASVESDDFIVKDGQYSETNTYKSSGQESSLSFKSCLSYNLPD